MWHPLCASSSIWLSLPNHLLAAIDSVWLLCRLAPLPTGDDAGEEPPIQQFDANGRPRRVTAGRRQTQSLADQQALAAAAAHPSKPQKHAAQGSSPSPGNSLTLRDIYAIADERLLVGVHYESCLFDSVLLAG